MSLPAILESPIQPYEIGQFDQIFIDHVEVKIKIDGTNGKVFERVGGNGVDLVYTNAQLAALKDRLVVVRRHYDPRNDIRKHEGWALRDLSEQQQEKIAFRLEWASRLARHRAEVGPVAHKDRTAVTPAFRWKMSQAS